MTNGDKVRKMSDEELATMLDKAIQACGYCHLYHLCLHNGDVPCKILYLKWLREEVQEDG